MAYNLSSFTAGFWGDPYDTELPGAGWFPTTIADALEAMDHDKWYAMISDLFPEAPEEVLELVEIVDIFPIIAATDTVSNLDPPVEVWIDEEGVHTILVHEREI